MTAIAVENHPNLHQKNKPRKSNIFHNRYRNICILGKGNFGKVYLAEDMNKNEKVAIKVVDKRLFKNNDQKQHAQREQSICKDFATDLNHDNIVKIFNVSSDDEYIYIIMEYIEGGELFEKIKQYKRLTEPLARRWFREIIEAIHYIHKNGIVHRDLKPENVLIDKNKKVKLCDFGFGKRIQDHQEVLSTYCGSPFYAAPEMVTATPYKGPSIDMWSCGVILYAMLTGTLPFRGDDMPQLFKKISKGIYITPKYISSEAANLIKGLLCKNAKDRMTAADCLDHPWLQFSSPTKLISTSSTLSQSLILATYYEQLKQKNKKKKKNKLQEEIKKYKNHKEEKEKEKSYHKKSDVNSLDSRLPKTDHPYQHHKKQRYWLLYRKKTTQVVPASIIQDDQHKKKSTSIILKLSELKIIHQFKNLFRNTSQKRIGT